MQRLVPDLINRAAEMLGGFERLADFLGVEEHTLHFWRQGRASAPGDVVESLVDLVLKDDVARAHADRRKQFRDEHLPPQRGDRTIEH